MACFLLQCLLFIGASATVYLIAGVAHLPLWLGGIGAFIFLGAAWFAYLYYQARHPEWWPPWDEGLPQEMRMMNAFAPVAIILVLGMILVPVFQKARMVGIARQQRLRLEQRQKTGGASNALHSEPLDLGPQFGIIRQRIRPRQDGSEDAFLR